MELAALQGWTQADKCWLKKCGTRAAFNWKFSSNAQLRAALQRWKEEEFCFPSWSGTQNQRTRKEPSLITDVMWRLSQQELNAAEPKSRGRGQVPIGTVPVLTRGQVQNSESELKNSVWQYQFPREPHLPNLCKWKWGTKKPCTVLNWGLQKKWQYRSLETRLQRSFNIQGLNNVAIIFITLQNIFLSVAFL